MASSDKKAEFAAFACAALAIAIIGILIGALYAPIRGPLNKVNSVAGFYVAKLQAVAGFKPIEHLEPLRPTFAEPLAAAESRMQPGVTLLTGLFGDRLGARLVDVNGAIVHEWPVDFFSILAEKKRYRFDALIHGAHLFENGDLLVSIDKRGMIRIDACGKIIWLNESQTHHSIDVDDDGFIWAPKGPILYHNDRILSHPFHIDEIVRIDPATGETLETISLGDVVVNSDEMALVTSGSAVFLDILHVNDVEILDHADAAAFPLFSAGDIMVSSWQDSAVFVIDRVTKKIKWSRSGPTQFQHDPDFRPNGTITVLDNRGYAAASAKNHWLGDRGGSRIVAIRPGTRQVETLYQSDNRNNFYTPRRGKHQWLANGNLLITETDAGRAFEVTPDGDVVWQYVNRYDADEVGWLMKASRHPATNAAVGRACPRD